VLFRGWTVVVSHETHGGPLPAAGRDDPGSTAVCRQPGVVGRSGASGRPRRGDTLVAVVCADVHEGLLRKTGESARRPSASSRNASLTSAGVRRPAPSTSRSSTAGADGNPAGVSSSRERGQRGTVAGGGVSEGPNWPFQTVETQQAALDRGPPGRLRRTDGASRNIRYGADQCRSVSQPPVSFQSRWLGRRPSGGRLDWGCAKGAGPRGPI
jgi:hypothetical protein